MGAICRTLTPRCPSRTAAFNLPTACTKSARCATGISSTSADTWRGSSAPWGNCASAVRWRRVDIKSVALLPNVLAKQTARDRGAREAWLVDARGYVTEGASSNAWIVGKDTLIPHQLGNDILPGITRSVVLDIITAQGLRLEERAFTIEEAHAAREAFVTSASQTGMPVVRIDGRPIGEGRPGPIAKALRRDFHAHAEIT